MAADKQDIGDSSPFVSVTLDGEQSLASHLTMKSTEMCEACARAMLTFANEILARSARLVPKKTGELVARGFTEGPLLSDDGLQYYAVVGYEKHSDHFPKTSGTADDGTKPKPDHYAVWVHERTDLHHPNGQAKFLEEPYKAATDEYLEYLAEAAKKSEATK